MALALKRIGAAAVALFAALFGSSCSCTPTESTENLETVYGPPSYFGIDENDDPYSDVEDVYGPPEWFEGTDGGDEDAEEDPYNQFSGVDGPPADAR